MNRCNICDADIPSYINICSECSEKLVPQDQEEYEQWVLAEHEKQMIEDLKNE